jgi:hypothetical protein
MIDTIRKHVVMTRLRERLADESGFMGTTHALSAVAAVLAVFAFKEAWYEQVFHTKSIIVLVLLVLVIAGGALMPDLDNTQSSAKSSLGFIGKGISMFMRVTAPILKTLVHTKYDKDLEEAHRGFYHTALAAFLFGAGATFLCSDKINIPISGFTITGKTFAIIIAFIASHIALSVLAKPILRQMKSSAGPVLSTVIPTLFSIGVVWMLISMLPDNTDYTMMGVGFGIGWLIHELGDCLTTQGDPILAPIPIRGKCWYNIRILPIKAGGLIENFVFIPVFTVIIIISIFVIVMAL